MHSPSETAATETVAPKVTARVSPGRTPADAQRLLEAQQRRIDRNARRAVVHERGQANYYFANQES